MKIQMTAKTRLSLGLMCLLVSVLIVAVLLGIVPDRRSAVMKGRGKLCEALSMNCSVLASQADVARIEAVLTGVVRRDGDILSAGLRRDDGKLVVEVGDHQHQWYVLSNGKSTDAQIQVPLWSNEQKWGTVELRFVPLGRPGIWGFLTGPWVQMTAFVAGLSFLLYLVYLGIMLRHLDPSKVVPGRVRSALDSLTEGLLMLDNKQRIVLANEAFAAWVGISPKDLTGRLASKLPWLDQGGKRPDVFPWTRAIEEQAPQRSATLRLGNGESVERIVMVNCSPVLGSGGKYRGVLVSCEDITQLERKKLELADSRDAAETANRTKSEFLANISHEIRTPMNAILGYTEVLQRGYDVGEDERRKYLGTIQSSGEHLLELINDILDLSKVESGRLEMEQVRFSPYQIMAEIITVLRGRAEEKGLRLECRAIGRLPETILSDPARLRQTLTNLVGNAIKFTEAGSVQLVGRFDDSQGTPRLAIDVIDTGIGIAPGSIEKIFDPFRQADNTVTRQFGGTGLGLAISKQYTELLGGALGVQSTPGKGSVFTVTIDPGPLGSVRMLDHRQLQEQVIQQATGEQQDQLSLPPCAILVVDDNVANQNLLSIVLRKAGAEVQTAADGQAAVALATARRFDVVLMDMQMPVMDGYAATRKLREQGATVPIIALTGHAMKGDKEKCLNAGCTGFVPKPVKMADLFRCLHGILGQPPEATGSAPVQPQPDRKPVRVECHGTPPTDEPPPKQVPDPRRAAEEDLPPLTLPSPPLSRCAGRGEDAFESAARPSGADNRHVHPDVLPHRLEPASRELRAGMGLPTDDAEYCELIELFVRVLREQLDGICRAWSEKDYKTLAELAHSIKGSGGSFGYDQFTAPAKRLELTAKQEQPEEIPGLIKQLLALAERVVVPALGPSR